MKRICLLMVIMLFVTSLAQASLTRLAGMGLQNWMVDDDANIWFSPAYINDYPGRIWGEFGTGGAGVATNQWGGASMQMLWGFLGNAGIYYARPYAGLNNISTANVGTDVATSDLGIGVPGGNLTAAIGAAQVAYGGNYPVGGLSLATLPPVNQLDIFYGFKIPYLAKFAVVGNIAGNYAMYQDVYDTAGLTTGKGSVKNEQSTLEINVGAGATIEQLGPIPQLDVIAYVGIPIVNNTYLEKAYNAGNARDYTEDIKLTNAGSYNLNLAGRIKLTLWNLKFLVFGGWGYNNLPTTLRRTRDTGADATLERNLTQQRLYNANTINAGIALNHKVTDKTLVVMAIGANYIAAQNNASETEPMAGWIAATKGEYNWSQATLGVPINIGIEHQLPWWGLIGRAGLMVLYQFQTTTIVDPNYYLSGTESQKFTTTTYAPTTSAVASLGLGKQITETLSADLLVRQNATTGLLNSLTTQMTLVWKFK